MTLEELKAATALRLSKSIVYVYTQRPIKCLPVRAPYYPGAALYPQYYYEPYDYGYRVPRYVSNYAPSARNYPNRNGLLPNVPYYH